MVISYFFGPRKVDIFDRFYRDMLSMGKSKPWQDAFKNITGYRELTAQPIKDYFQVLYDWMKEQRKKEGYSIGWEKSTSNISNF